MQTTPSLTMTHRHPPGPAGHRVLGCLPEIRRDPLQFLLDVTARYGDVLRFPAARWHVYVVSHPDGVQHVLQDHHANYGKGSFQYRVLRFFTGNGLLTSDGDFWRRQRRLAQPVFQHQRIAALGDMITATTAATLDAWEAHVAQGAPLDMEEALLHLTLDVLCRALFGGDFTGITDPLVPPVEELVERIAVMVRSMSAPLAGLPTAGRALVRPVPRALDDWLYRLIRARRQRQADPGDMLALLMAATDARTGERMTDDQLRDELVTLLIAGHETSAYALIWTCHLLAQHPATQDHLHAEIVAALGGRAPTMADLPNLPYARATFQEGLRLYPPAWLVSRMALAADEIGGYSIPAGAFVLLSPYVTHRHAAFWEQPHAFRPERFLSADSGPRHRFAWFPFGGGPHLCIGNGFAMVEAQLMIAAIIQRFRLEPTPAFPVEPEPLITIRPRHGLPLHLHPRAG